MDRCENGNECERLLGDEETADEAVHRGPPIEGYTEDDRQPAHRQFIVTRQKVAYGLGHVFNDITATIWFSYTMVFMQNVIGMPSTTAGFLLFFG